jgi:hypothetical protein
MWPLRLSFFWSAHAAPPLPVHSRQRERRHCASLNSAGGQPSTPPLAMPMAGGQDVEFTESVRPDSQIAFYFHLLKI